MDQDVNENNITYYYPDGEIRREAGRKFSVDELIRIFGGWYTLSFVFKATTGTDFYIIRKELTGIAPEDYPPLNDQIRKLYNRDVYGLAIVCADNYVI